jgi:predicted Zn-dependent protease
MTTPLADIARRFTSQAPAVDAWTLRLVAIHQEGLAVRQGVLQPLTTGFSRGAMLTVIEGSGIGYAATADLGVSGLGRAVTQARYWARASQGLGLLDVVDYPLPELTGQYHQIPAVPWEGVPLEDKIALLQDACQALKIDDRIVDSVASLYYQRMQSLLVSSRGGAIEQTLHTIQPGLTVVANQGSQTQRRSGAGADDRPRQGGMEQLPLVGFPDQAEALAEQALALLSAPECPSDCCDLLLMPNQMVLQIHESIGHPLELDRILGDERNYAGTSFVTLDMFGSYRYGSELLNVTFDPGRSEQLASYGFDDEGTPAERTYLIRDGILQRPLGGAGSQARARLPGVANARACSWNRPPIDRMANVNLEPGSSSLPELIGSVERGILMDANRSWSIDDSRNKFQFGCELGRLIEQGELKGLVRNPNYRGISANFWRGLAKVGDAKTLQVGGTPNCGKGEPNQVIQVGHAAPACLFREVEVFGGES